MKKIFLRLFTRRLRFEQFINLIPSVDLVIEKTKKINNLCDYSFDSLFTIPYKIVKYDIPELIKKGKFDEAFFELIKHHDDFNKKRTKFVEIEKTNNYKKFAFLCWIMGELEKINELEKNFLSSPIDPVDKMAGIEKLGDLGDFNIIDEIAGQYNYTHDETLNLSYYLIFQIQLKAKLINEIRDERNKILEEKRKNG